MNSYSSRVIPSWLMLAWLFFYSAISQAGFTTPALSSQMPSKSTFQYHAMGQKEHPVVFILGGGPAFSSWNLEPIQQQVADLGFYAILMDMQGIGENAKPFNGPILPSWIAQIAAVKQSLAPNQTVSLIAHSWGALMAMLYQRAHPDAVNKLILLNPVDPEKKAMEHLTTEIDQRNTLETSDNTPLEEDWDNSVPQNIDLNKITLRQIQQVLPTYFYDYQLGLNYAKQFSAADFNIDLNVNTWKEYDANPIQYHQIAAETPKYFMDCTQDYLMPYNLRAMQAHWSFQQVAVFEKCGHFPWIERPTLFTTTLKQFLED